MSSIKPFKINISDAKLLRLKQKLALTDYPLENDFEDAWTRGIPPSHIKRLTRYWENDFDWRKIETDLNSIPQFETHIDVDGISTNVHFVHQRSAANGSIPLLFLHGWQGNFLEATKILPELTKELEGQNSFDVVAPSLANFGFSSTVGREMITIDQHAKVYHELMSCLGYTKYVIQAGDMGYLIGRIMASKYGSVSIRATHFNCAWPSKLDDAPAPSASESAGLQRTQAFIATGDGYRRMMATRPMTIGYSLSDSPVGLLAFLYEKMHDWSDAYPWTNDEILTWVSIYWFAAAGPSAAGHTYFQAAAVQPNAMEASAAYIDVPLSITRFEHDVVVLPKSWNKSLGPIVHEDNSSEGGHFAAWEKPDVIVRDVRAMMAKISF